MRWMPLALVAGLAVAPGCNIYFGDDGNDDVSDCWNDGAEVPPYESYVRDPDTGECVWAGGGGGGCEVRPHEERDQAFPAPGLDWGQCYGYCESLDEWSCIASDGCRAVYDTTDAWGNVFRECWALAPSGPIQGGECWNLDGYECSRHNDCSAVFWNGRFAECVPERGVCDGGGAPPGPNDGLRNPESGKCEWQNGPGPCGVDVPTEPDAPIAPPDWATCTSYCTGLGESDCKATDGCRAIFWNKYPPNADAFELEYKECWATAPSGPVRGGDCTTYDSYECSLHDDCVANHDSDWFDCDSPGGCPPEVGKWISCGPEADVPPPPPPPAPRCDEIVDEDTCIDMVDGCVIWADGQQSCGEKCSPIYEGEDCVCDPSGCECQSWVFTNCVY